MLTIIEDRIKVTDINILYKMLIRVKCVEYNVNLSEAHINLLLDFYHYGVNSIAYEKHLSLAKLDTPNYFKSVSTINNAKTYFKKLNILVDDQGVSLDYLPPKVDGDILLTLKVLYGQ